MKINIPRLGQQIRLAKDWTFDLHPEARNASMFKIMKLTAPRRTNVYMNNGYSAFVEEIFSPTDRTMSFVNIKNGVPIVRVHPLINSNHRMDIFNGALICTDTYTVSHARHQVSEYERFHIRTTLPVNTLLAIDRIYIRKGSESFDSVTFKMLECDLAPQFGHKSSVLKNKQPRFWVKLDDANEIEC